jgi:hypothetical protein
MTNGCAEALAKAMEELTVTKLNLIDAKVKLGKAREALKKILDDQRMAEMTTVSNAYLIAQKALKDIK